ncbi:UNVERIFIED_ORG: molybdopterin synthase sulfur carrier subunit [Pseudomonas parafulva]|jgi:molybdopterin synthase sulfur carrier subunit|uniref:Molybdopterin synthase sulfur carrier subunit n=1 Tax=Pseudomonas fulva TaxID=47880 RepID=A0A2L1WAD5_9PSED|nr:MULTISPECIES: MoaD/ThiS family protein [Pseudomonas]MDP9555349.1 molybdopterin synthase sulfur carrier subunit [Pseudomonas parafulva]MDP9662958.1 molybdopterin synthase sulfur carrier subunit [Pseudomonas cremoricolorata]HCP30144.1 MoaD/ThiS family protein [Pseudomonas sp.]AVF54384.1 MoaD/ThiS family protein [Pseudomonas fulva]MBA1205943.1 MoaD/ThiS family protein [Pseudomonas fulva]
MKIKVMYFARYRERLGRGSESLEGTFKDVDDVRLALVGRGEPYQVLAEQNLMCARNEELCRLDEPVQEGDEVAFFPPVTGG